MQRPLAVPSKGAPESSTLATRPSPRTTMPAVARPVCPIAQPRIAGNRTAIAWVTSSREGASGSWVGPVGAAERAPDPESASSSNASTLRLGAGSVFASVAAVSAGLAGAGSATGALAAGLGSVDGRATGKGPDGAPDVLDRGARAFDCPVVLEGLPELGVLGAAVLGASGAGGGGAATATGAGAADAAGAC